MKAEKRAREFLPDFASDPTRALPPPSPAPAASRPTPADEDESPTAPEPKKSKKKEDVVEPPLDEDEIPYADAEIVDEPTDTAPHVGTGKLVPKPKLSAEDAETPSVEPEVTGPRKAGR